jgi:hypothetical protein
MFYAKSQTQINCWKTVGIEMAERKFEHFSHKARGIHAQVREM